MADSSVLAAMQRRGPCVRTGSLLVVLAVRAVAVWLSCDCASANSHDLHFRPHADDAAVRALWWNFAKPPKAAPKVTLESVSVVELRDPRHRHAIHQVRVVISSSTSPAFDPSSGDAGDRFKTPAEMFSQTVALTGGIRHAKQTIGNRTSGRSSRVNCRLGMLHPWTPKGAAAHETLPG